MKKWNIWIEGYSATGAYEKHRKIATAEAETFREAVIKFSKTEEAKGYGNFNEERLSFWACRVHDNAADAARFLVDHSKGM
jgi:hypothetical protein